jgi:molybdenum cofactor biosynthesis protein B
MGHEEHENLAEGRSVGCAVVTCSDTRTPETDTSGRRIMDLLAAAGHETVDYQIIPDEPMAIRQTCKLLSRRADIQALIFSGGTGISRRDNTADVIGELLSKSLPGFGELFRMLSYTEIGPAAFLSRALAGLIITRGTYGHEQHTVVFCVPGSTPAAELAMTKLILPQLAHLAWEIER